MLLQSPVATPCAAGGSCLAASASSLRITFWRRRYSARHCLTSARGMSPTRSARAWRRRWSSSSDSLRPDIEFCLTQVSVPSAYHFDVLLGERHPLLAAE